MIDETNEKKSEPMELVDEAGNAPQISAHPSIGNTAVEDEDDEWVCKSCGRPFETQRGLSIHFINCPERNNGKIQHRKRHKSKRFGRGEKTNILHLFRRGFTRKEVSRMTGRPIASVTFVLAKYGYSGVRKVKPRKHIPVTKKELNAAFRVPKLHRGEKGTVVKLFEQGRTRQQIAAEMHKPYHVITNYLAKRGYKRVRSIKKRIRLVSPATPKSRILGKPERKQAGFGYKLDVVSKEEALGNHTSRLSEESQLLLSRLKALKAKESLRLKFNERARTGSGKAANALLEKDRLIRQLLSREKFGKKYQVHRTKNVLYVFKR